VKVGCIEGPVHLRLVFPLWRQKPCCNADCDNYCESDEWCIAATVSLLVQHALEAQTTDPFAIVYVKALDGC
jgi:hypothetical protein